MTFVSKKYVNCMEEWKATKLPHECFLCKKITKNHFIKLKSVDLMGYKTPRSVKMTNSYYAFGCKKRICKRCFRRNMAGCTVGTCRVCKNFMSIKFSYLEQGDPVKYGLDVFNTCQECLRDKNVSLREDRFNKKQGYIPRGLVNIKTSTLFLGYKRRLAEMSDGAQKCGFSGDLREEIQNRNFACSTCGDHVAIGNTNHVSTMIVYVDNKNISKIVCSFCDRVYGSF